MLRKTGGHYISCVLSLVLLILNSCAFSPPLVHRGPVTASSTSPAGFRTQMAIPEPSPEPIEQVETLPGQSGYSLTLTSSGEEGAVQIPATGAFQVEITAGDTFQIVKPDAMDGPARITVPAAVFDLYISAQHQHTCPELSPLQPPLPSAELLTQMDAVIAAKAQSLIDNDQPQCVYLPTQRQNANCNSNSQGLQCSGSLNQTLPAAKCPEMAVLAGHVNLNQTLSSRLFLSASQHLNLNAGAEGILVSHGNLNVQVSSQAVLQGVVLGQQTQNFNLQGQFKGLYKALSAQAFPFNQQSQATFAGALCTPAQLHGNPNGVRIHDPNLLASWADSLPILRALTCETRPNFYTSQLPLNCISGTGSLNLHDSLYGNTIELSSESTQWARLPGRPVPVPASWSQGESYVLNFENQGVQKVELHWFEAGSAPALPVAVRILPRLDCIQPNRNGTFTAYLGYDNQLGSAVDIPIGVFNRFGPEPIGRGQPTHFAAGSSPAYPASAHSVVFTDTLSWEINRRRIDIQAADESKYCPQSQTLPIDSHTPVRKTLLPSQLLTLNQDQQTFHLPFEVPEAPDLQRRVAVNLINGSLRVEGLKLFLNGQPLAYGRPDVDFLNADVADMVVELQGLHQGQNALTLEISGSPGAQLSLSIEGFMRTAYIPHAFHSAIEMTALTREAPVEPGVVGLKFMEGLKVRLHETGAPYEQPYDLTGFSLAPLRAVMAMYDVEAITNPLPGTPAEKDASEQAAETRTGYEAPNMNLFYELHFAETQDVWELIDQLNRLPFIEEVYPRFVVAAPQMTPTTLFVPAEVSPGPGMVGDFLSPAVPKDKWLRVSRIMNQNAGLATPFPTPGPGVLPHEGAWDITRGIPGVKVGVLEGGVNLNHEDLENINQLKNINPPASYSDFSHGTQTLGTIGATHNHALHPSVGQGSVGVAHGASVWHIWTWDNQFLSRSLCLGTNKSNCLSKVDSLAWAKRENMKVVLIEAEGDGVIPGTIEHTDPPVRTYIDQQLRGSTVILPAGNRACERIKRDTVENKAQFNRCWDLFPSGKDVRRLQITEPIYKWQSTCESPNPLLALIPGVGPIIVLVHNANFLNCVNNNNVVDYYRFKEDRPMPDTGSVVVGVLKLDGSGMILPDNPITHPESSSILPMNYGKSNPANPAQIHGVDVSASEKVYTATYVSSAPANNAAYGNYSGTSGASAVIAGVVALMYSVNPNLTPVQVRNILRQTQQPLPSGEDTAGMVNAHAAVCEAAKLAGSVPSACQSFGTSGFSIASQRPSNAPESVQFWLLNNGQRVAVEPGDMIGIAFDSGALNNLQVQIGNQSMPILELAENYAIFGVPKHLPQGLYDVLLSLGGQSQTLTQALDVLTDCRSDEIITDNSWTWLDNGSVLPVMVSHFFAPIVHIPPTASGQMALPIWSQLISSGHATCVDCTFDFFKTYTLPADYQVRYGQIEAHADDTATFIVNQHEAGTVTFSFNTHSIPEKVVISPELFPLGVQQVNLQIQAWNKVSLPVYNYAAVAAKFTLRSCRR